MNDRLAIYGFRQRIRNNWRQWTCHHDWSKWAVWKGGDTDYRLRTCAHCGSQQTQARDAKLRGKHSRGWENI